MKLSSPKSAFSIVFALGMVVFVGFISLFFLSLIIPYSRTIKSIEFSTHAYYNSNSGLELGLYETMSGAKNKLYGYQPSKTLVGNQDLGFAVDALSRNIPELGTGNSDFDLNWNRISISEPLQLYVGGNNLWNSGIISIPILRFRVPNTTGIGVRPNLAGALGLGSILWQISSTSKSLSAVDTAFVSYSEVNNSANLMNFGSKIGKLADGTLQTLNDFYAVECNDVGERCALKFSIIGDLKSINGVELPYLEYQIITTNEIPSRFSLLSASGSFNGYTKNLEVQIPQLTTNAAFDFTVFQ